MTYHGSQISAEESAVLIAQVARLESFAIPAHEALSAFDAVAAHLGLKAKDIALVHALVAFTDAQDWLEGQRPVVTPSDAELCRVTALSPDALAQHLANLVAHGVIAMKDKADGIDLSPLSARTAEFEWLEVALEYEAKFERFGVREAAAVAGTILATLNGAVFNTPNRAFKALKGRLEKFFVTIPQMEPEQIAQPARLGFLSSAWTGVVMSDVEGQEQAAVDLAKSDQPRASLGLLKAAAEIMANCRLMTPAAPKCFDGCCDTAHDQPHSCGLQGMCVYEKSVFATHSDRDQLRIQHKLLKPAALTAVQKQLGVQPIVEFPVYEVHSTDFANPILANPILDQQTSEQPSIRFPQ